MTERPANDLFCRQIERLSEVPAGTPLPLRNAAEPMDDLAAALDVDIEALREQNPAAVRQMEIACCQCSELARCEKAIADGVVGGTFRDFCPNADEFERAARGERI